MSAGAGPAAAVLPPGVQAGPLGRRALAAVIDNAVPAVIGAAASLAISLWVERPEALLVLGILAVVLTLAWALAVWWMLAVGAASPGMRVMGLQLVGLADGRAIGWGRVLLRQLVYSVVSATGLGFAALIVFLVLDVRHQGWHDMVGKAVVIRERVGRHGAGSEQAAVATPRQAPPASSTVGLPAHLTGQQDFSGAAGGRQSAGSASSAGEWGSGPAGWSPDRSGPGQSAAGRGPVGQGPYDQPPAAQSPYGQSQHAQPPSGPPGYPGAASGAGAHRPGQGSGFGPDQGYRPAAQGAGGLGPGEFGPGGSGAGGSGAGGWRPPPGPSQDAGAEASSASPEDRARWGRPEPGASPAVSAASATPPPPAEEPVDDGTRVVGRSGSLGRRAPDAGWLLALEDGREVAVTGLVLIGRNPQPRGGEEQAELVRVGDSSRTVSKTHLAIGVDQRGIYVVDRGSTNGSAIANSAGEYEPCAPGDVVRVREGQLVSYGQHRLEIKRSYD